MTTDRQRRPRQASPAAGGAVTANTQDRLQAVSTKSAGTEKRGDGFVNPAATEGMGPTWGEAWRHECEVRFALSLPDRADKRRKGLQAISKREYLDGVLSRRGQAAHDRLRDDMVKRWKASR